MSKNYFIIHGAFGNSQENWLPWLEKKLLEKEYEVFNFDYPTPNGQNYENWANILNKVKDKISKESIFICHSLASIFLIKYCITNNLEIGKFISVCGFNNYFSGDKEFDEINKLMFVENIQEFINLCHERICFYSLNDPYIKLEASKDFAHSIQAKSIIYKKAGHFNETAGFKEFPYLIKFL